MASKAAAYVKGALDTEEVLGAVRDVASVRMEHAHHHSAGSLASVISGNQFILHPSSLIAYGTDDPPEFKERLIGRMTVMVLSVGPVSELQRHHGGEQVYVRAGCVLPLGVTAGRWSRHHSSAKAIGKRRESNGTGDGDEAIEEGFEVYIQEYEDVESHTKVYPRISFSIRTKRGGMLGGSKAATEIVTLNYQSFWEGPSTKQVLHHIVPFPHKKGHREELHIRVALAYDPIEVGMAHKGVAEAAMNQHVRSTYEAKASMKKLTREQLALDVSDVGESPAVE